MAPAANAGAAVVTTPLAARTEVAVKPRPSAPAAPGGLVVSDVTIASFRLSWAAAKDDAGVAGYDVFIDGDKVGSVPHPPFTVNYLVPGTTYVATVKSRDAAGNLSPASQGIEAVTSPWPLGPPRDLNPGDLQPTEFNLQWTAPHGGTNGVAEYDIFCDGAKVGTSKTVSFRVSKLASATSHALIVVARDHAGVVSEPSAPVLVTTPAYGEEGRRSVRVTLPKSAPVLRGIIIRGNGAGGDLRAAAGEPELVALGESLGFAVLGTAYYGNMQGEAEPSELSVFEESLQHFAMSSGHPEITRVPWLPIGHSNGGNMSWGFNALRPQKCIAVVVSKGGYPEGVPHIARPVINALATPGLLVAGAEDLGFRRADIRDAFVGNRPRGALWAWVEEEGMGHSVGDSRELTLPFVEAMAWARHPPTEQDGAGGAASLVTLDEREGWLVETDSGKAGLAAIAPYGMYTKDRSTAGWLPNRRLAFIFRAFASYDKASPVAQVSTGPGPVNWGTAVTYLISRPKAPWRHVDFYEGDVLLKRVTPESGEPLAVRVMPAMPGYAVFHGLVTFADGTQRTTMPRRVFVQAGPARKPGIRAQPESITAKLGETVTFSVSVAGYPLPHGQWLKDGIALVNGPDIAGAAATTLTLLHVQPADVGTYAFVARNAAGEATSKPAELRLADQP
ncbi:MAG TPA: immunoglobulin domain-containing protein [Lacunisphaera sp.]|nr:immunoglobulin domain-containing protein [Lacunisphaera sp.]